TSSLQKTELIWWPMSLNKIANQLYKTIFRGRLIVTAVMLLFVLYGVIYLWFYVPYGGPVFVWRPDSQLIIQIPETESSLQAGDIVLSIEGTAPRRMRPIYSLPLQEEYEFDLQRGGETITALVLVAAPLNSATVSHYLPATLLSLAGWLVGTIILLLARHD